MLDAIAKIYWYTKGTVVGYTLRHKQRQKIKYLEQLLQDIIMSSGADHEELLSEAVQYLKDRRQK